MDGLNFWNNTLPHHQPENDLQHALKGNVAVPVGWYDLQK